MSYNKIYQEMRARNREKIIRGGLYVDPLLRNNDIDIRRGLGLFSFGAFDLNTNIERIIHESQQRFPEQIIYRAENGKKKNQYKSNLYGLLHHTFFQCAKVGSLPASGVPQKVVERYKQIVTEELANLESYTIAYKGLIAVPTGIVLAGYPDKDINSVRNKVRDRIMKEHIFFVEPYQANTAHSTLLRLSYEDDGSKILRFADEYRNVFLGTLQVSTLELVFGTWRMWREEIKPIARYEL